MPYICCPICNTRISSLFILKHAATCNPRPRRTITKKKQVSLAERVTDSNGTVSISNGTRSTKKILGPKYFLKPVRQNNLSEVGAPGFHVHLAVFSDIHATLLSAVQSAPPAWSDYKFRQAKNYGPPYDLRRRRFLFGPDAPKGYVLPSYVKDIIIPRLRGLPTLQNFQPNQLTVGLYRVPGESHILPHNDCENAHIATAVVGVCLGGACTMTLILRKAHSGVGRDVKHDVFLPPGAVYIMSGDSLRVWHHAIFPGKTNTTRTSLTFRDAYPFSNSPLHPSSNSKTLTSPKRQEMKATKLTQTPLE